VSAAIGLAKTIFDLTQNRAVTVYLSALAGGVAVGLLVKGITFAIPWFFGGAASKAGGMVFKWVWDRLKKVWDRLTGKKPSNQQGD
jgi:hypothetical protein